MLDVCLIGTGGMMPLPDRWLTAFLVRYQGRMALIDCGEGTQIPLRMLGWGFKSLDIICITHYHGDHIAGLPGILLTLGNAGKTEPLTMIGPKGLRRVVQGLRVIAPELPYEIEYIECSDQEIQKFQVGDFHISTCPGDHTLPCVAYTIEINRQPRFQPDRAEQYEIPRPMWKYLQQGEEIIWNGQTIIPSMVLGPPRKGLKVSYCTDTRPTQALASFIQGADLFVCEGMYGDDDKVSKAIEYKHMLFSEAAKLAAEGEVKELWLTHYSPSLTDPEEYIQSAQTYFTNVRIGKDLMKDTLAFDPNEK
ncbi:MAG: ribonuclease Z [Epulopiscium sp.]|nr:ribonuclease Z [Candidatus Epulonipiscium sp.]